MLERVARLCNALKFMDFQTSFEFNVSLDPIPKIQETENKFKNLPFRPDRDPPSAHQPFHARGPPSSLFLASQTRFSSWPFSFSAPAHPIFSSLLFSPLLSLSDNTRRLLIITIARCATVHLSIQVVAVSSMSVHVPEPSRCRRVMHRASPRAPHRGAATGRPRLLPLPLSRRSSPPECSA
jgi:hypothetical protein